MDFETIHRERNERMQAEFGDHPFTLRGSTVFYVGRIIPYAVLKGVAGVNEGTTDGNAFEIMERAVLALLAGADITDEDGKTRHVGVKEAREEFLRIANDIDQKVPVTYLDLLDLQQWMIGEATRRPPTQASSSSDTPSSNGTSSTETSSAEPDEASKA